MISFVPAFFSSAALQSVSAPKSNYRVPRLCTASLPYTSDAHVAKFLGFSVAFLVGKSHCQNKRGSRRSSHRSVARKASAVADAFLSFISGTGSPAHTVLQAKVLLDQAGFKHLSETDSYWELEKGGRYYLTKEGTSICAFVVGGSFDPHHGGVVMAAAHTDSPCLKVRPCSKVPSKAGTLQLGVDTYGGGLWHTWFDRPLGVAGKVILSDGEDGISETLVKIDEPILVIPNLAIHLQSPEERKSFSPNKETELRPVLCVPCGQAPAQKTSSETKKTPHHEELVEAVAKAAGVDAKKILDVDLCLFDATPPCFMGPLVSSPRIDNVLSTWAAFQAVTSFAEDEVAVASSQDIVVAASFDHEEVGSVSATGADSAILGRWLDSILLNLSQVSFKEVVSRSFLLSCDCAHGLHPNYVGKHQDEHQPLLGKGVVIKNNVNQRYATTPILAQMLRSVAKKNDVAMQEFLVRNDCPCGSTIGPLLSAQLGVRAVDVGAPQWAMHSCRETAHSNDIEALYKLCFGLFKHFRFVDSSTKRI